MFPLFKDVITICFAGVITISNLFSTSVQEIKLFWPASRGRQRVKTRKRGLIADWAIFWFPVPKEIQISCLIIAEVPMQKKFLAYDDNDKVVVSNLYYASSRDF